MADKGIEKFKKFSIACFNKNKTHPKSPYDPKTMQAYNTSTPDPKYTSISSKSGVKHSATGSSKPKRKHYDTSSFLDDVNDEEDDDEREEEISLINASAVNTTQKEEVGGLRKILQDISRKIENVEKQNDKLRSQMQDMTKKRKKSKRYQASNRTKGYVRKALKEEQETEEFVKWNLSDKQSAFSNENKELSNKILKVVKGWCPETSSDEITDGIHIRFKSLRDTEHRRLQNPNYLKDMAKKTRKDLKVVARLNVLSKSTLDETSKTMWKELITADMMSSDEEEIEGCEKFFLIRKPCWRPKRITELVETLDSFSEQSRSDRSKFQRLKRKVGAPSLRPEPTWSNSQITIMKKLDLIESDEHC